MLVKRMLGIASIATVLGMSLAPAVAEAPATGQNTVALHVNTAGLDLTQTKDQASLRHRVAVAASKLCSQVTGATSPTDPGFDACFHQANAEGRQQADIQIAAAQGGSMVATTGR
jgi:UrcA family protein